ncbi:ABC transporter transmembrane domain-containing protein, partial [Escherichia coli]|nr:ABC transporter transmembrane domain-containing protein [Escherichia coli]
VIRSPFLVIGAMVMSFTVNARLALIFVAAAPIIAFFLYFIMSRSVPFFKQIQKKLDRISLISRENLSGNRVIRAFGKQEQDEARFNEAA